MLDRSTYAQAELDSRNRRSGLWADSNAIPPWDYRHGTGEAATKVVDQTVAECPCGVGLCAGPKGGKFCMTTGGNKKYH